MECPLFRGKIRLEIADGASLLKDLFQEFSDATVSYEKVSHGILLTEYIIQNSPSDLDDIVAIIREIMGTDK